MDCIIPFRSLGEGEHQFEFNIDETFFEGFPDSEINEGKLSVLIVLTKRSRGIETLIKIQGSVEVICDRCLDEFAYPIDIESKLFFEFGDRNEEISDELIMLSQSENELKLNNYIHDYVVLTLPLQKVHPNDKDGNSMCNRAMIKKLEELKIKDNNEININPGWDKLKDLIN